LELIPLKRIRRRAEERLMMSHSAEAWYAANTRRCEVCGGRGWKSDPAHPYGGATCRRCGGAGLVRRPTGEPLFLPAEWTDDEPPPRAA